MNFFSIGLLLVLQGLPLVHSSSALASHHRVFADKLVSELYKSENECTSSLGISMAFSLVYPAGDEANREQMQQVLGYPATETHRQLLWNETQNRLDSKYNGKCLQQDPVNQDKCELEEATLEIANRIWLADFLMVEEEYNQLLGPYIFEMDFNSGDAGSVINEWVNASTRGLVDSIVDDGPLPDTFLVAVNSIYLKATWETQFQKAMTNLDSFYSSPRRLAERPSKVNFMHAVNEYPYSDTAVPGFQILQLRFHGSISMIIALPTKEDTELIGFQDIHAALAELEPTRVAVALPKFRFGTTYQDNLLSALQAIGLTAPFEGGLCFAEEGGCVDKVTGIIHKTMIAVNEEGVEAAAVTALMVERAMPLDNIPVLFLANHPFQFFIYESEEELVLFEGRVGDPGETYSAETTDLDAQHSDGGFWKEAFNVEPREHDSSAESYWTCASSILAIVVAVAVLV